MTELTERIHRAVAAFSRGEVDAIREELHPEVEWRPSRMFPEQGPFHGRAAVIGVMGSLSRQFEEFEVEVDEVLEQDAGQALVLLRFVARARGVETPIVMEPAHLWEFKDGKLAFCQAYVTRDEAFEATGIRQPS